jgi:hypothetical protein
MPRVTRAGRDSGRTIFQKVVHRLAPSSRAASSSSTGSPRKNCRRKKTPKADAAVGTMIAIRVSSQNSSPTMR